MAWTAPITWTSGNVVTKANLDEQIRDNMLETAPAQAATAGHFIRVTGANAIEEADPTDGAKLDGDKIDVDVTLSNITPDTSPAEVDDVRLILTLGAGRRMLPASATGAQRLRPVTVTPGGEPEV